MARLSIGEFLATLRKEKGFTQQDVADRLDVSNRTVSAWEKDKAMPDILLLPAIAELYGVTVDEILRGVKKEGEEEEPVFSSKTEKYVLNKKLARFTMQSYILLGVSILSQLFVFLGWFNDLFTYTAKDEFNWWKFAFYISLVGVIVVFAVLIGLWKSCESSVDSSLKDSKSFYLSMFQRVAIHFYVSAGLTFALGFVLTIFCGFGVALVNECIIYLVVSVVWLLVGTLLHNHKINTLTEGESLLKQSRTIMLFYAIASYLFAVAVFTLLVLVAKYHGDSVILEILSNTFSIVITIEAVDTTLLLFLTSVLSLALLLFGTLLFNRKLFVNDQEDKTTRIKMSNSAAICFYAASALYFVTAVASLVSYFMIDISCVAIVMLFVFSLLALLLGSLLNRRNLVLWCGEEMRALIRRNNKLYTKVVLWGIIPFAVGVTLALVGLFDPFSRYAPAELPLALLFVGCIVLLIDIAVCIAICFAKREKTTLKQ